MAVLGVLTFVFALLLSIAIHELGHLVTAKKFGMKASRYFIGMGPTLWSRWRGETEYGVKAFPIGGFVKIVGMTQLDELDDPRDEPRAFWRQPAPQRAIVLAAGSFMHFVIALVVLYGILISYGEPVEKTMRVSSVSECLEPVRKSKTPCAGQGPAPAKVAGIREGDVVVAFDGKPVAEWQRDFTPLIQAHPGGPAEVTVLRDGQRVPIQVNVARTPELDAQNKPTGRTIGRIGVLPGDTKNYNVLSAVPRSGSLLWELTTLSVKGLGSLPGEIPKLFKDSVDPDAKRSATGGSAVGIVDLGRISAGAFEEGDFVAVLGMVAGLNVFVGLFNLLPLLPLDGGHLAILGFEQARSKVYKLIGRRDPGRVDIRKLLPATVAFIVVMGSVSLLLVYAGFAKPISYP